jgi:hypothetical protein
MIMAQRIQKLHIKLAHLAALHAWAINLQSQEGEGFSGSLAGTRA